MIAFINSSGSVVHSVVSEIEREVSLVLKFNLDTVRYMQSQLDLQTSNLSIANQAKDMVKYQGKSDQDLKDIPNEELQKLIITAGDAVATNKTKLELYKELINILGIQDIQESGDLTFNDIVTIYRQVSVDPANTFPSEF